jgi:ribosome-associated translation inhibitor RaiA
MKSITLILSLLFLFCINSFGQAYMKLEPSDVDAKKVEIATKFANDYLTQAKNNSYYQFKDEAVDVLKSQLTEERQKAAYKQIKDVFGDYKSIEYIETWIQKGNAFYKIYRFKGTFEKSTDTDKPEIRVILNGTDQVAGLWTKIINALIS